MARRKRRARTQRGGSQWNLLGGLGDGDIEALAYLVMMAAAKSAREDLKSIMAGVRGINRRKARKCEKSQRGPGRIDAAVRSADRATRKGMKLVGALQDLSIAGLRQELDAIGELGELESLRLQMAMDRLGKLLSTLANLAKKTADTAAAITGNLK
jgi:hypothetical protein